jgi:hypothetical protein
MRKPTKFMIQTRKGRRQGQHGTRIQISDMNKELKSETMTVHNATPQEVMTKVRFYLEAVEYAENNGCDVTLTYKGEDRNGEARYQKAEKSQQGH